MSRLAMCWLALAFAGACGSEDGRPAEWEYISPVIFQPNCATTSCHSPANAAAGLDFSNPGRGFESLFRLEVWIVDKTATPGQGGCMRAQGTVVCPRPVRSLVIPYNPEQSRLVNMLRARGAARMPPDRPLSEADIRLVERWILNGAPWKAKPVSDGGTAQIFDGSAPAVDAPATADAGPMSTPSLDLRPDLPVVDSGSTVDRPSADVSAGDTARTDGGGG